MKIYVKYFLILFLINNLNAQERSQYQFQVFEMGTKNPISYATILLKKINKGTHADFDGVFQYTVSPLPCAHQTIAGPY